MVSDGVTVCGRSSACERRIASSMLIRGSGGSSIGESRFVLVTYLGVGMSPPPELDMYWSSNGNVWLRGRCELALALVVAGRIGLAVKGGTNGLGAVPESGVKKGDVGLNGPGENEDGAVSVKALFKDVVLCEWYAALPKSR